MLLMSRGSRMLDVCEAPVLLESEDHSAGAVTGHEEHLSQRKLGRVVGASGCSRFEIEPRELTQDQ